MNTGQEKFLIFILDNVEEENQAKARELLTEGFQRQEKGTFNKEYLDSFIPKMLKLIKEDRVEQVKGVMMEFKEKL